MKREELLEKISQYCFAVWELHIYLDTHPSDMAALMRLNRFKKKANELRAEYESKYGPLTVQDGSGETWLNDPWPWERSAN